MQLCSYRIDVRLQDNLHDIRERIPAFRQQPTVCKATMNFTDDSRLVVSGFAFLEFAPLESFSQKCIEDLEIGTILFRILFLQHPSYSLSKYHAIMNSTSSLLRKL